MKESDGFAEAIPSEREDQETSLYTYEILTYPADYTLEVLVGQWHKKTITVPEEQRKFIWSQAQSSKLIESFLMGLPVPPVYFYQHVNEKQLQVVDGLQRLLSIVYFFSGFFGEQQQPGKRLPVFSLAGLHDDSPYKDKTYRWLSENDELAYEKLNNSVLRSFVMRQLKPQDNTSIFQVFERLNSGGMVLQGQEIRNCIYSGTFNALIKQLNHDAKWREILGSKIADKRMRDMELILRVLALLYDIKKYKKPMKGFLNTFMAAHRDLSPDRRKKFSDAFTRTANMVIDCLGPRPFHIHRGLNTAVFDSVFTAFAKRIETSAPPFNKPVTEQQKEELRAKYKLLLEDAEYLKNVVRATTDDDVVPARITKADEVLFG